MGQVFVTGDTHGSGDILKLTGKYWPQGRELTRDDLLVICGDFGLVWSEPPTGNELFWLDWLEARPWTTLFLDGNHENHDVLDALDVAPWHGGSVHVLPGHPHILHLMRGQTYDMGSNGTWFVMGGARSQDRAWRVEGTSWWAREMPSDEEYVRASQALEAADWAPDYIFTHDCPSNLLTYAMPWYLKHRSHMPQTDALTNYLQYVDESVDQARLRRWYAGHYHHDFALGDERHVVLYQQVVELGDAPLENADANVFVPGVGIALPDHAATIEEVAEREHATLAEAREFAQSGQTHLSPDEQEAFRLRVNMMRRKELRLAGPCADIL